MTPKKLTKLLANSFLRRRKIMLVSSPGLGKSDLVAQAVAAVDKHLRAAAAKPIANSQSAIAKPVDPDTIGADLIIMHPAVSDPTDYKGMPAVTADGTRAEFLPFGDLNRLIEAKRLTVCFLDDVGQAPPAVQAALMQLVLARRVNGHKIADCVVFVAATNDTTHMAGVSGILEPLKSRWDSIITMTFSSDDFSEWLSRSDFAPECVAFARSFPHEINAWDKPDFKPNRTAIKNVACPRTVASMFRWYMEGEKDPEVLAGAAGEGIATVFLGYLKMFEDLPSVDEILRDPANTILPTSPGGNFAVTAALARKANPQTIPAIATYAARLAKEYEVYCLRDAMNLHKAICQTKTITDWCIKNRDVFNL